MRTGVICSHLSFFLMKNLFYVVMCKCSCPSFSFFATKLNIDFDYTHHKVSMRRTHTLLYMYVLVKKKNFTVACCHLNHRPVYCIYIYICNHISVHEGSHEKDVWHNGTVRKEREKGLSSIISCRLSKAIIYIIYIYI